MGKFFFFIALFCMQDLRAESAPVYEMVTASIVEGEVLFASDADFEEATKAGFFRIKAPSDLNLEAGREFARTFTSNPRYNQFGALDVVNGYLLSEIAQTVRFALERDHWNEPHRDGAPIFPFEIQELGRKMNEIGVEVLKSILRQVELPESLWFEATAGATAGEGSQFVKFNCYDPKLSSRPFGVGPHKDWGLVSLLDASGPGLEAKIDGVWRSIQAEDGYLIVNFGIVLEKLLPGVTASEHRVITQTEKMRTSIVAFADPRVGPYRPGINGPESEGFVYDWDPVQKKLMNGQSTISFFEELSQALYGADQSGSGS